MRQQQHETAPCSNNIRQYHASINIGSKGESKGANKDLRPVRAGPSSRTFPARHRARNGVTTHLVGVTTHLVGVTTHFVAYRTMCRANTWQTGEARHCATGPDKRAHSGEVSPEATARHPFTFAPLRNDSSRLWVWH